MMFLEVMAFVAGVVLLVVGLSKLQEIYENRRDAFMYYKVRINYVYSRYSVEYSKNILFRRWHSNDDYKEFSDAKKALVSLIQQLEEKKKKYINAEKIKKSQQIKEFDTIDMQYLMKHSPEDVV